MKRNKGYSKKKQAEVETKIRELIGKNYSDFEIQEKLNLQPHVLRHYKKKIYDKDKINFQHMTAESVLADYAEKAQQSIDELEVLIQQERTSNRMSLAHVQAVKLKHRLENQIIKHAQGMGMLPKRGRELELANMHFQKHSMKDIQAALQVETENMMKELLGEE